MTLGSRRSGAGCRTSDSKRLETLRRNGIFGSPIEPNVLERAERGEIGLIEFAISVRGRL